MDFFVPHFVFFSFPKYLPYLICFPFNFPCIFPPLILQIRHIYDKFVETQVEECLCKCRDDLKGMTRFVTWDVDGKGGSSALYKYVLVEFFYMS